MRRAALVAFLFVMMRDLTPLTAGGGAPGPVSGRSEQAAAAPGSASAPQAAPSVPQASGEAGARVIVLDPGHGGTDAGARGPSGVLEKDVVLALARALRMELERRGWKVALTREGNDNPSFDDRAALANAHRRGVFLTLHVSSTGTIGTVRSYYRSPEELSLATPAAAGPGGLLPWEQAQAPYAGLSRRFAELLQVQLAQKFRGSPEVPSPSAVRQLRMVTSPAVAIEISSVAVPDAKALESMAPELGAAVARALEAFRPLEEGGGK